MDSGARAVEPPPSCRRARCDGPAAFRCAYVDRRGRPCGTAWCAHHCLDVDGGYYCARHASTVVAVGQESLERGHLPELDNRVPSLVWWVGRDLDHDVPVILAGTIDHQAGETMVIDPVALVTGGGRTAERRWERNWKVVSHTGISQKVTLQVLEDSPTDVVVRVGHLEVAHETPPWITARLRGVTLDPAEDADTRRAFYTKLHNAITAALATPARRW